MQQQSIPIVSEVLMKRLEQVFRNDIVEPGMTLDQIMYTAGQQSVLAWLDKFRRSQEMIGDPIVTRSIR